MEADRTMRDTELKVVVLSQAVRQEYVAWVCIDLLSILVSTLLEVNDQHRASTDLLPLSKP